MAAHLARHPAAAARVAAYLQQRDAFVSLGRYLAAEPVPPRLAGLEAALVDAVRRQGRARRTVATAAAVLLTAAVGWAAKVASPT